ncbi:5'-methylthioadenosine/S-adenosylhomocysteine nucleosidase [Candidatus Poribacteria bacterium]|nr:5'-methylthioadenosine/S-adenosylhomocysteine nucleosidase [Candidatus Poribacteria bacterium]
MRKLIITPMKEELDFLLQSCTKRGFHTESAMIGRLSVVHLHDLGVILARGGLGKVQFAIQTQHLLDTCSDWDLIVCAGAAGALADEVSIGDVVVATTTVEHDYNNKFNERALPTFDGARAAIADLKSVSHSTDTFSVHFGPIASGDEDVVETERKRMLHESTGALAVAWEGIGGAKACAFSSLPFVEVRGVTDTADHNAASDFEKNLEVAMSNLATLIISWTSHVEQKEAG